MAGYYKGASSGWSLNVIGWNAVDEQPPQRLNPLRRFFMVMIRCAGRTPPYFDGNNLHDAPLIITRALQLFHTDGTAM